MTSFGARRLVIVIGTLCRMQVSRSCSSRSFDLCTIWFTAYGAASGCAASVLSISFSQPSSASFGRAFSAGNDPTIPALHCSMTSFGLPAMNIGAAMTGMRRRCRTGGSDIGAAAYHGALCRARPHSPILEHAHDLRRLHRYLGHDV